MSEMMELDPSRIVVTLDSEWAPDFVVEDIFSEISVWNVPTTCFLTDATTCNVPLATEIGVHLNFLRGSTQGATKREVISNIRAIFPDAVSMRSHGLYWDDELPSLLKKSGFQFDSSLKGMFQDNLEPVIENDLIRIPYWWSDVFHLTQEMPISLEHLERRLVTPGLKVLKFHMMYVWLNCRSQDDWNAARAAFGSNLRSASRKELSRFRQSKPGIGVLFSDLLQRLASAGRANKTICEVWDQKR